MAKLPRVTAKIFASNAAASDIGQYGSALAGTKVLTSDISTIQALPAYETGWRAAVVSTHNYPTLQEMNGLQKTFSQQIAYLLQQGVAEWDSATTYYENNFCAKDNVIYYSLSDDNINHDPANQEGYWQVYGGSSGDRYLITAYINGTTWYRLYSDGWIEQGGYVATSATDLSWGQPTLSGSNGTLGGNSFAVTASAQHTTNGYSNYAWKAFDNNDSTMWTAGTNNAYPYTITIYNPTPLKVLSILMSNRTDTATFIAKSGTVEASNTDSNYTTIANWTNSTEGKKARWSITVNSPNFYKYYRISIATSSFNGQYTPGAMEIDLTATYQGSGSNGVTFPITFSNTNYSFTLGFQGAAGSNVYISSKSTTGFSLNNTSSSTICWMACGY